jgi:hypothetical protein
MKKTKLLKKLAMASVSMLACATCFAVAVNAGGSKVVADETPNVALSYTFNHGTTGAVEGQTLYHNLVEKTNASGQTLKGLELSSSKAYTLKNNANYPVNGYSMGYGQYLTVKINDKIDMSEPVEFFFTPYVIGGKGGQANHRFVMALSDTNGQIKPLTNNSKNGFNADSTDANFIYWEFLKHQQWANAAAPETQGNGPSWYAVSSEGTTATGYAESQDNVKNASAWKGVAIPNSRMGSGVLGRAFYGVEYAENNQGQALVKASISFTETTMVLQFSDVYDKDITKTACGAAHTFSESGVTCTSCTFQQTYNLADLGFEYNKTELNLYFGYYNVHARYAGESYGDLPMSLKLYNYTNGEIKSFEAKEETVNIKANEELVLNDAMDVVYYDGVLTPTATVSYASSDETIAKIVDGKLVPVAGTVGGAVTVTATASTGETATFTVNVDANTVTLNGNVIAAGDAYTILENLYAGNKVLVGYKADGALYAVGDTITLTKDIVLEEVTVDFTMLYGASIRLDDTASIRFTAVIKTADLTALQNLVGADKVSYGMTLTVDGKAYTIESTKEGFQTGVYEEEYTLYSAVMTGIPATDYATELTAQAWVKVTYADGETATVNSNLAEKKTEGEKATNVRSLQDVAVLAYNDRQATKEGEYQYEDGNGQYSPYTSAQLQEIAKYLPNEEV